MRISGMSPEEYANLWGSTKDADGVAPYNVSSENQMKDTEFWATFIGAVLRLHARVLKEAGDPKGMHDLADARNLWKLYQWAAKRAFDAALAQAAA